MTDLLPPPPGEIVLDPPVYGEAEYVAQGGAQHQFFAKVGNGFQEYNVYQFEYNQRSNFSMTNMISEFTDSLKEALAQGEIDSDVAQTFADIFDINLKRSFEFTATVEFTFTVEVDNDADVDCVVDNLNFEISEGWGVDYELDNCDYNVSYSNYAEV
jgi:hypothetical protein